MGSIVLISVLYGRKWEERKEITSFMGLLFYIIKLLIYYNILKNYKLYMNFFSMHFFFSFFCKLNKER